MDELADAEVALLNYHKFEFYKLFAQILTMTHKCGETQAVQEELFYNLLDKFCDKSSEKIVQILNRANTDHVTHMIDDKLRIVTCD